MEIIITGQIKEEIEILLSTYGEEEKQSILCFTEEYLHNAPYLLETTLSFIRKINDTKYTIYKNLRNQKKANASKTPDIALCDISHNFLRAKVTRQIVEDSLRKYLISKC